MRLRQFCLALVAGLALAAGTRAADVQQSPVLLVANPKMDDFFRSTVLFARPIGNGSHIGFIVNRPTELTMAQIFPGHAASKKLTEPVFFGGPLNMDAVFAVVQRAQSPGGRAIALADGMFLVMDADTVDQVIEQNRDATQFYVELVV